MLTWLVKGYSQNSMESIFAESQIWVEEFENKKVEVVYLDYNILTDGEATEENVRSFSSGYKYIVVAYGDPDRIAKVQLTLYEVRDGKLSTAFHGEAVVSENRTLPYMSRLIYSPKQDINCIIQVSAENFSAGATSGRYFVMIGHPEAEESGPDPVEFVSRTCQDMKVKMNKRKPDVQSDGGAYRCDARFFITSESISRLQDNRTISYKIKKVEETDGGFLYTAEDDSYTTHLIVISTTARTIDFYKNSSTKMIPGVRFFIEDK